MGPRTQLAPKMQAIAPVLDHHLRCLRLHLAHLIMKITDGCQSDEKDIRIQGVSGDFCSPACVGARCPTDVPPGVTAQPQCALRDQSGDKYCALICTPGANDGQCGTATCKAIQGVGICTYDDSMTHLATVLNPDFFSVEEIVV